MSFICKHCNLEFAFISSDNGQKSGVPLLAAWEPEKGLVLEGDSSCSGRKGEWILGTATGL